MTDRLFHALQDPTRREIVSMLQKSDLTAGDIAEAFAMSRPSISYHLDLLRQAGLVSSQKEGQFVRYRLETTVLQDSVGWLLGLIEGAKTHAKKQLAKKRMAPVRDPGVAVRGYRGAVG